MPASTAAVVGTVTTSCVQLGKDAYKCLKDKYDKVKKIKENFNKLEDEEKLVHAAKSTLEEAITRNSIDKEPTEIANAWLKLVEKREREVQELKRKYEDIHNCLCGMCPFFKLLKLSEKLVEKTEELKALKDQMDLRSALREKKLETVEKMDSEVEDDIPLSHAEMVEKLLKLLADDEVRRIGIWGMAGVGKSTILKRLHDKANESGMFEIIIWVTVEEEDTLKKIQSDILDRLQLVVQSRDRTEQVADKIFKALEKKKYLLLLDQVPTNINLDQVGIRNRNGKLVIASREKFNCKRMDIDRVIKVSKLSNDDAWKLFRDIVGEIADRPRIKETARRIVKELGGLPLAIRAIAAQLQDEPECAWPGALWALQSPDDQFQKEHVKELFKAFNFSYDRLPDDRKKCLLYGALFPKGYEIDKDYLVQCWRSEQFIADNHLAGGASNAQKLRASRDRGQTVLQDLTEACLFEWSSKANSITMPLPFRTMTLRFSYPQERGFSQLVRAKEELDSPPEMEEWRNTKRISLMCNKLKSLHQIPSCPTVTTLLLQRNKELVEIHDSFFISMGELRVLDLYSTKLRSLPPSIINLVNLRALYLNECQDLVTLSEGITDLKNLEILDIRDTGMQSLPIQIAQLVSLRCLRVSFVYNPEKPRVNGKHHNANEGNQQTGRIVPPGIIGNLHRLEELTIMVDPREKSWNRTSVGSVIEEIVRLESLTALFFCFPAVENLTAFIANSTSWNNENTPWKKNSFRAFQISVGANSIENHNLRIINYGYTVERNLRFFSNQVDFCDTIQKVLRQSSSLELIGNQGIQNLSGISSDCMESLEVCVVESCHQISSIVSCGSDAARNVFPFLDKLHLVNLKSFCCILDGSAGPKSFSNLAILTVHKCPKLKKLISLGMLKSLINLQHVKIQECSRIEEVIETDEALPTGEVHNLTGFLPELETLELVNLPHLVTICKNDSLDWRSLQKIEIIDCSKLNTWSIGMYNAKHLRKIECQESWWGQLDLPDQIKGQLKSRCYFIREEPPSAYYTPREDGNHPPPDLRDLPKRFEENRLRHSAAVSEGKSSKRCGP